MSAYKPWLHRRRTNTEGKVKVVTVGWGTYSTVHWVQYLNAPLTQQGWFEEKLKKKHFRRVGVWCDGIGWSSIFSKHPFRQAAVMLFILFLKSSWFKMAYTARNCINSVSQAAATTFVFSSVGILLLYAWLLYLGSASSSSSNSSWLLEFLSEWP